MGEYIAGLVLALADSFKGTAVPGYVVLIQMIVLIISLIAVNISHRQKLSYIRTLIYMLQSVKGPLTKAKLGEINPFLLRSTDNNRTMRQKRSWANFCDGLEEADGKDEPLSALVSPVDCMSRDTMQIGHGIWRQVPGLFVSTGLVLTFLGLIAALRESGQTILLAGQDPQLLQLSLSDLLRIASAKFIMSLAGLVSSIILGFYMHLLDAKSNSTLSQLTSIVEGKVKLASPERTLANILSAIKGEGGEPAEFLRK
jgi:hypothetical protein